MSSLKITVVGSGYVGMSLAVLLAQNNDVTVLDIDEDRIQKINANQSTIKDKDISIFLSEKSLSIKATLDKKEAYKEADYIIIATPTNYDEKTGLFDTSSIDSVCNDVLSINKNGFIIIKSTLPIGYTSSLQKKYNTEKIIFSPEFLREGKALHDNLYPSRIIIGSLLKEAKIFGNALLKAAINDDIELLFVSSSEAEAIKLFSNTYLAMRVAFFNELDSFALSNSLNAKSIIDGICLDERVGQGYNNPSFGYGGYCLPKDTKQLLSNFDDIPQKLIEAIVLSNETRKNFISQKIIERTPNTVGFYRLVMKEGSDNFRESAVLDIIENISTQEINVLIYEPSLNDKNFKGFEVSKSLEDFKSQCDVIVANRLSEELIEIKSKVISRDIFGDN